MPRPSDHLSIVAPTFKEERDSFEPEVAGLVFDLTTRMPYDLHMVTFGSPRRYKAAVETLAWYFKREFQYDFPGYTADETDSADKLRSFFWAEDDDRKGHRVVGACSFRVRSWTNLPESYWTLCWIWIHPFRRGRGLLHKAWPFFTEIFEPLDVEHPISPAMEKFLADKPHRVVYTTDEKPLAVKLYIRPDIEALKKIDPKGETVMADTNIDEKRPFTPEELEEKADEVIRLIESEIERVSTRYGANVAAEFARDIYQVAIRTGDEWLKKHGTEKR